MCTGCCKNKYDWTNCEMHRCKNCVCLWFCVIHTLTLTPCKIIIRLLYRISQMFIFSPTLFCALLIFPLTEHRTHLLAHSLARTPSTIGQKLRNEKLQNIHYFFFFVLLHYYYVFVCYLNVDCRVCALRNCIKCHEDMCMRVSIFICVCMYV